MHDFLDKELGKAIPYGVYDVAANTGWVSVGTDHDTAAFAVETMRRWWDTMGRHRYPDADRLLICADGGGSNGYRVRAWKVELAAPRRRDRPDDHRLPPAAGHQQMEQDRTPAVLPDHPELARPAPDQPPDDRRPDRQHHNDDRAHRPASSTPTYPTGIKYTTKDVDALPITRHDFHGEWNYTVQPTRPKTT